MKAFLSMLWPSIALGAVLYTIFDGAMRMLGG